ncbi:glycosyltransferase family 2 protein [Vibrio sp. YYF0003]|uniref:glycosyltransferase family 2 protein n=1 Tax=Vibrio sp. YYF0003 TaxID=3116646 RepID=UPI002ECCF0B2|nr:glycosyltransferase family A protein [Vibrio sp. YYF0003]
MNDQVEVSIILPVYNVEKYLRDCLDSVNRQTFTNYEIIAVNDGSTDRSLNILLDYKSVFFDKLKIINTENKGLSMARNRGLETASGEYVYFLDSDDTIENNTLERCLSMFKLNDADLVMFNANAFCDGMDSKELEKFNYVRGVEEGEYPSGELFKQFIFGNYIVQSCCYMFRRKRFKHIKFIPGMLHEDNYFTTSLLLENVNVVIIKDSLFNRRIRPGSIMTSVKSFRNAQGFYDTADLLEQKSQIIKDANVNYYLNVYIKRIRKSGVINESRLKNMTVQRWFDRVKFIFSNKLGVAFAIKFSLGFYSK